MRRGVYKAIVLHYVCPKRCQSMLPSDIIFLADVQLSEECLEVQELMRNKFTAEEVDKRVPHYDWARWSVVLEWIRNSKSILDVGTGQGTFINSLARANAADELVGIDIRTYSLYSELFPGFRRIMMDAERMEFPDNAFDVVTCMEVIEHLPDGKLENVIAQLRRVSARRLIVSFPFCEPLPLSKYHSQQFTPRRVKELFPNASYTLLLKNPVTRVPWLIIDEQQGSQEQAALKPKTVRLLEPEAVKAQEAKLKAQEARFSRSMQADKDIWSRVKRKVKTSIRKISG